MKMSRPCLQILSMAALVSVSRGHFLDADGFHRWRYNIPVGPHPLEIPPHPNYLPPPRSSLPLIPIHPPPQVILVPVHVRGTFPPFIERIVQRIQTWWSFYNPPESLTRPPPHADDSTDNPEKKVTSSTSSSPTTPTPTPTTPASKQEADTEALSEAEVETTTSSSPTDPSVSTLAVFEVTPSPSVVDEDTEEPLITPERASLLGGQREAYLRFLQTGTLPPYMESDVINEADD